MKIKKIYIIITILIIIVLSSLLLTYYILKNKSSNKEKEYPKQENAQVIVSNLLQEVAEINKVFKNDQLSDNGTYVNEYGDKCSKYKGEDQKNMIDKLNNVYIKPFLDASYFELSQREVNDKTEDILYICQPSDCQIKEIDIDEFEVINQTEDEILVKIGNSEYFITKDNSKWKFTFPLVICEK